MRKLVVAAGCVLVCATVFAQPAVRVEYGKASELANVKSVFLAVTNNPELEAAIRKAVSESLPSLTIVPSEEESDLTLIVTRGAAPGDPAGKQITAFRAARATHGMTIRLYLDTTSTAPDLAAAAHEVIVPFVRLLQDINPDRFGRPAAAASDDEPKRRIHSTAGLRVGLSKREVRSALGNPTKVAGTGYTQTWTYKTTDGDIRLVFGGDRLVSVTVPEKK